MGSSSFVRRHAATLVIGGAATRKLCAVLAKAIFCL
jgi:hypothetical protein